MLKARSLANSRHMHVGLIELEYVMRGSLDGTPKERLEPCSAALLRRLPYAIFRRCRFHKTISIDARR